jgi:hypothetical protein
MLESAAEDGAGPENRGAGGRGLLGLPPYLELGVPGRGLPLMSARSYPTLDTEGGRTWPGLQGRVGDPVRGGIDG